MHIPAKLSFLMIALLAPVIAFAAIAVARPAPAEAHPLGNFTINRYSRLDLYSDAVRIRYVLDMAEIPTFQETPLIDTNGDGEFTAAENEGYLAQKSEELAGNLHLTTEGSDLRLTVLSSEVSYPDGQAGLPTLRLGLLLSAPISGSEIRLEYRDDNYADRIGWKEVIVRAAEGVTVSASSAPTNDTSAELTSYPADLLSSPLDITSANISYAPGHGATAPTLPTSTLAPVAAPQYAPRRAGSGFASLIETDNLTLSVVLLSLLLALGFGAFHALEPGHGKTFVAAYFVGVKGTVRQALGLGLIVAMTHTMGVLAIGLLTLFGSRYVLPERLYPWLSLASGLMVLALGARLIAACAAGSRLWRRFVSVVGSREHQQEHLHNHGHRHEPSRTAPPWKSLLALGLADGLTPSPSALIVLLAAVSLNRIGLGVLLIVAFSVGLAAVLTLVSLTLLCARRFLEWFGGRKGASQAGLGLFKGEALLRVAPLGGSLGLVAVGVLLTVRALSQPGLDVF